MTDNDALVCELLPCPVCGDKPKWRGSRHDYAAGIYRLQCLGETHLFQAYGASEEKCIAAWNARPPLTPQAKPLDPPAQDEAEVVARAIYQGGKDSRDSEVNALREENARLRGALETAAIRLAHLSGQIEASHGISGTLRAEQAMKARHMSDEARAVLTGRQP